ncbi:hypothetical protein Pelo_14019 [Pelomyxa schiedti]|nr:hypothetical protein Pelo_14019 [Pelomyxa schiedti]
MRSPHLEGKFQEYFAGQYNTHKRGASIFTSVDWVLIGSLPEHLQKYFHQPADPDDTDWTQYVVISGPESYIGCPYVLLDTLDPPESDIIEKAQDRRNLWMCPIDGTAPTAWHPAGQPLKFFTNSLHHCHSVT